VSTFLIGYDTEASDPATTAAFVESALRVHEDLAAPCSLFIVGATLRHSAGIFRDLVAHPLFDLQQHTDTHMRLKTVYQRNEAGVQVFQGGSPDEVRGDVAAAQRSFEEILGFRPIGLTGPYGYYRGLCDRPDLVQIVADEGIRFLRCWGRDAEDWQPVAPFQPFWLDTVGFPEVLEFGIHGWQDCLLRESLGWDDHDSYFARVCRDIKQALDTTGIFSYVQHDWSSIRSDPDMRLTRRILEHAKSRGMEIVSYATHYEKATEALAS
jgi:peptidoglycan/xylan/chitin deacetylase (PgdA/CDA1 family)